MNRVDVRTGSEGPRQDPYHFEEISVDGRAGCVELHVGLGAWLSLGGIVLVEHDFAACRSKFEELVGVDPDVLLMSIRRNKQKAIARHLRACSAHGEDPAPAILASLSLCARGAATFSSRTSIRALSSEAETAPSRRRAVMRRLMMVSPLT